MKQKVLYSAIIIPALLAVFFTGTVFAKDNNHEDEDNHEEKPKVCFCHNIPSNPHTVCVGDDDDMKGHKKHVREGKDTLGTCVEPTPTPSPTGTPSISPTPTGTDDIPHAPEFNLVTGTIAFIGSIGAYVFSKRAYINN